MGGLSWAAAPLAIGSALLLTSCGTTPERSAVTSAASGFVDAVTARDGRTACAFLTENAAQSAGGAMKTPCATAVLHLTEHRATVTGVQVSGDAAEVKVGGDVVFLRRLEQGWRVSAAGCTPQPGTAYRCDVEG